MTVPRPLGVTVVALLTLAGSLLTLLGAATALSTVYDVPNAASNPGIVLGMLGVFAVPLALAAATAYGFWTLKPWAWRLSIILYIVMIVLVLLRLLAEDLGLLDMAIYNFSVALSVPSLCVGTGREAQFAAIAVAGLVLLYLHSDEARKAFGRLPAR
jgi:hypothetical protein